MDLNVATPHNIDDNRIDEILITLKDYTDKDVPLRGHYIDIGDRSSIQQTFSCPYREFMTIICYLIKSDKMKVIDYEGSSFLFEFTV